MSMMKFALMLAPMAEGILLQGRQLDPQPAISVAPKPPTLGPGGTQWPNKPNPPRPQPHYDPAVAEHAQEMKEAIREHQREVQERLREQAQARSDAKEDCGSVALGTFKARPLDASLCAENPHAIAECHAQGNPCCTCHQG